MNEVWPKDERLLEWSNETCKGNKAARHMNNLINRLHKLDIITTDHLLSDKMSNWIIQCGKDENV